MPLLETMIEYTRRLALDPDEHGEEVMVDLTEVRKWTASIRQEGRQEGLKLGLLALVRQFERRLGRPLSEAERATLGARVDTLGPERLGDVVLDLAPDALGHWLGDPDAR